VIHLDTHVVVWLYQGQIERFPASLRQRLAACRPLVSPMVRLELALLHEIGRLTVSPAEILDALRVVADLGLAFSDWERVAATAGTLSWTRDPFDRMIVAHALADDLPLVTKDAGILERCGLAVWG